MSSNLMNTFDERDFVTILNSNVFPLMTSVGMTSSIYSFNLKFNDANILILFVKPKFNATKVINKMETTKGIMGF